MDRIKVLIADDQRLFAHGIEIILRTYGKTGIAVAGIAENGSQAVRMAERLRPDVILMDVRMPVMDGTEATRRIHRAHPEIKILVLTTFDDDDYVFNALDAGAIGYVVKNVKPDQLVTAIRAVHAGDYFVSPAVGYKLVQRAREGARMGPGDPTQYHGELNFIQSKFERLTRREAEIPRMQVGRYRRHEPPPEERNHVTGYIAHGEMRHDRFQPRVAVSNQYDELRRGKDAQ